MLLFNNKIRTIFYNRDYFYWYFRDLSFVLRQLSYDM